MTEIRTKGTVSIKNPNPREFVDVSYEFRDGFTTLVLEIADDYYGEGGVEAVRKLAEQGVISNLEEWEFDSGASSTENAKGNASSWYESSGPPYPATLVYRRRLQGP